MKNLRALFFIVTLAIAVNAQTSPLATVRAFYKYDRSHSQTFNRQTIDARKQWFSPDLYKLLLNEIKREKEYLKQNPTDKPHFGDGLPFQPLNETCDANGRKFGNRYRFGEVTTKGDLGNVDVYFSYPKACKIKPVLYAVNMSKEKGRWVIDDIRYISDNTSLVEDLQRKEY